MSDYNPFASHDSWKMLMNLANIPWDDLIHHEARILNEFNPEEIVTDKNGKKGRYAVAYKVIQILKELE